MTNEMKCLSENRRCARSLVAVLVVCTHRRQARTETRRSQEPRAWAVWCVHTIFRENTNRRNNSLYMYVCAIQLIKDCDVAGETLSGDNSGVCIHRLPATSKTIPPAFASEDRTANLPPACFCF